MRGGAKKGWRWRVAEAASNRDLNLLYEPGNWGDILKGMWAALAADALARRAGGRPLAYVDPFAGAPTYPLVAASRGRLDLVPAGPYREIQEAYAGRGLMASTALLVRDAARAAGGDARLAVFDSDPERLAPWREVPGATAIEAGSGEEVLEAAGDAGGSRATPAGQAPSLLADPGAGLLGAGLLGAGALGGRAPDLLLVDPYDFFVRWPALLAPTLRAARRTTAIIYLYNKAPRGPGQQRLHDDFLRALRNGLAGAGEGGDGEAGVARPGRALCGRVPADASLARAHHEVIILGPLTLDPQLEDALAGATRRLAEAIARSGAFARIEPGTTEGSDAGPRPSRHARRERE